MAVKRTRTILSNGLPLVVLEIPGSNSSAITFFSKAGTRMNPDGMEGLAHLFEHLLLSKTKKYPSSIKLSEAIEGLGATSNGFTSRETVEYTISSAAKDVKKGIEILNEIINKPLFDDEGLSKEKLVIEKEQVRAASNPEKSAHELMYEIFFAGTPLEVSNLGTSASLETITLHDVEDFWEKNYVVENSLLCVAGGVSFTEVERAAERTFGKDTKSLPLWKAPTFKYSRNRTVISKRVQIPQVTIELGFRTKKELTDAFELHMIEYLLGIGWTSRLKKRLRIKEPLIYSGRISRTHLIDTGGIFFIYSTDQKNILRLIKALSEEIVKFREHGVSERELQLTRRFSTGLLLKGIETSQQYTNFFGWQELMYPDKVKSVEEYAEAREAVTKQDIEKTAKKYFRQDNWYLSVVGDADEEELKVEL